MLLGGFLIGKKLTWYRRNNSPFSIERIKHSFGGVFFWGFVVCLYFIVIFVIHNRGDYQKSIIRTLCPSSTPR